jgi:hypothetical protein
MGKIYDKVVSSAITNAAQIACVVPTDHLLVCSVSNWGGYALAAAATTVCAMQRAGSGACALFPVCDVSREWGRKDGKPCVQDAWKCALRSFGCLHCRRVNRPFVFL